MIEKHFSWNCIPSLLYAQSLTTTFETITGAKLDNVMNIFFFIDIPDQKFFLFQNLLVCIHSYSSPHSIWTSLSHDWKTLFVKLHTETFIGAIFDNDFCDFYRRKIWQRHEYFLYRQPRSITILFQNLLVCIHPYSSPQFIWTSPWFDWKTLFVNLHIEIL